MWTLWHQGNYKKQSLHVHVQSIHEGVKYCYKASKWKYVQSVHEGIKYDCNVCEYKVTRKDSLLRHVKSEHEGFKYYFKILRFTMQLRNINFGYMWSLSTKELNTTVTFVTTRQLQKATYKLHVKSVHDRLKCDCEVCDIF